MYRKPLALAATVLLALLAPAAHAAIVPGQVIDGPSNLIQRFSDIDMAPDGSGALAYVKKDGAAQEHIFVSLFNGAGWSPPQEVSTGLNCNCAHAHVAAGNGGRVVVTFVDAGNKLQSAIKPGAASPFQQVPVDPGGQVVDADVDMDPVSGIAYAVKDSQGGGGHVTASRLVSTTWQDVTTGVTGNPLDKVPVNNNAGDSGSQAMARIAVDSGGNAVAVWPEGANGSDRHVYVRRINGTVADGTTLEATVETLAGHAADHVNAEMVDIDGGGSPNPWVVFREQFTYPAGHVRDLARQLIGNTLSAPQVIDGLPLDDPTEGAEHPYIDVNPAGQGLVGLPTQLTFQSIGSALTGGLWTPGFQVAPGVDNQSPFPVATIADSGNGLIAWVDSSAAPQGKVSAREWVNGALGGPITLSRDGDGQVLVGDPPVVASSSAAGTAAIGFGQQGAATSTIVAAVVDLPQPPVQRPGPTAKPAVSGLRFSRKVFAQGRKLATVSKKRRHKVGTTISFNVSLQSSTTFSFAKKAKGFRSGRRCVAHRPKGHRKARRCTRYVKSGSMSFSTAAGTHRVHFEGRLSRHKRLKPGSYRLTVVSKNSAGQSPARRASFRLLKR